MLIRAAINANLKSLPYKKKVTVIVLKMTDQFSEQSFYKPYTYLTLTREPKLSGIFLLHTGAV